MTLDLHFVYYRSFRFDGKFHVRCSGEDLGKVDRIRYELERVDEGRVTPLEGISVYAQAHSGKLEDHGCPATFVTRETLGRYQIRPRVVLQDVHAIAMGRPIGMAGVIDMAPLSLRVDEGDLDRSVLDKLPLASAGRRGRRALVEAQGRFASAMPCVDDPHAQLLEPFVPRAEGTPYPTLLIQFAAGGFDRFVADLQPQSGSELVRQWPQLRSMIDPQPLLAAQEQTDQRLAVLGRFYQLEQPAQMRNATYLSLLQTLAALAYVESLQFIGEPRQEGVVIFGLSALLATLLTGAAVVAGNRANEQAKPTPDFEPRQNYLDPPSPPRWRGMNIREAWHRQVTGKGARIHFSDGGLYANHEDLRGNPRLRVVTAQPNDNPAHGTASSGILLALRNGLGVTGICHDGELYLYDNRAGGGLGEETLKALLRQVQPGDIVGINRQTANVDIPSTVLPAVHDKVWWEVIDQLSRRGAVVLVAAGNGSGSTLATEGTVAGYGLDLSQWRYFSDHGDADAILVGACHSWDGKPHQYSNHSYRYRMLNSWGDSVTTLSYGALQDKSGNDRDYTDSYSGTSSATPLVTGALGLIQSYAIERHHVYLDAKQMHLLVMASGYQDATLALSDVLPMGARPNVQAALAMLDRLLGGGRFASLAG